MKCDYACSCGRPRSQANPVATLRCRRSIHSLLKSVVNRNSASLSTIPLPSHLILTTNQLTMSSFHTATHAAFSCVPGHTVKAVGNEHAAVTVHGGANAPIAVSMDLLQYMGNYSRFAVTSA
jgi:hypothetical protein